VGVSKAAPGRGCSRGALVLRDGPSGLSPVARFRCVRIANRFARNGTSGFLALRMRADGGAMAFETGSQYQSAS